MNLICTLLLFVQLSICRSTTAEGRQSDDDAHLPQQKASSGTFAIKPGFETVSRTMQKRTANGAKAIIQRLISEGKSVFSRSRKRVIFQINGDAEKAYKDFCSFDPVHIRRKHFEGESDELTGWAYDRYLSFREKGRFGDPILDVVDIKSKGQGRYAYRFIYKKPTNDQ